MSLDRKGIDYVVWSDAVPFPVVIQCKGFQVQDHEIDVCQVNQCLKSIVAFRKSRCKADTYVLVHNRTGQNELLRETVTRELENLVIEGCVKRAELWDRKKFLKEVFNAMLARVRDFIGSESARYGSDFFKSLPAEPIREIPVVIRRMRISQYKALDLGKAVETRCDPVDEILKFEASNITVVIGEAGYGKTTVALRSLENGRKNIFYVRAADIGNKVGGSKQLLEACLRLDALFSEVAEEDLEDHQAAARPVIELLLKDESLPVVLILDGLDESIYFSMRGGIQTLFNQLREVKVPVVLTARTAFWNDRLSDFSMSFGKIAKSAGPSTRLIKLLELCQWTEKEIEEQALRYANMLSDPDAKGRVGEFVDLVRNGRYSEMFGDIPQRPLFLRMILETIAEQEIKKMQIAGLFYDWAKMKILRDIHEPMREGAVGREPILAGIQSSDEAVRLSFSGMMIAAAKMTEKNNGEIFLSSECELEEILSTDELRKIESPTGLFLNSLLLPVPQPPHKKLRVRFGHRAYQEFFLALHIHQNSGEFDGLRVPDSVCRFLKSIEAECIGT
ncbi:hypothetical protein GSUET_14580 [Geobacter sulfurreducens subsp. ethanolicus]|nr:hypothetical protein GSUET_14580 [Geobacter sulfurreducens subsp. ethanolicus]